MTKPVMKYGARKGKMSGMRRWMAKASARDIRIFPVPGADVLRKYQGEFDADFIVAPNPREANVLLVVGELTDSLAKKAAVAYQQIPRPRVLVVAGSEPPPCLPEPDMQVLLDHDFLEKALLNVKKLLRQHAWSIEAEPWEPEFLSDLVEDSDNGGGHDHHHGHGSHEDHEGDDSHQHSGENHGHGEMKGHDHNYKSHDYSGDEEYNSGVHDQNHNEGGEEHKGHSGHNHEHGRHKHNHSSHGSEAHGPDHRGHGNRDENSGEDDHDHDHGHTHEGHDHSGHDHNHGGHDHSDMDFMSMVAMTKDLPRPKDGLPMNRSEVHFGPFHPGLPGGLSAFMELDGDTVIEAHVDNDLTARSFAEILPFEAHELPDVLARLNPLAPGTYRLLARKALENAVNDEQKTSLILDELVLLETERIASHLNWLATFAKTLGSEWMHRQAGRWHRITRKEEADFSKLLSFLDQIRNMPYLQRKLSVGGAIPEQLLHHLSGPVAKAAGREEDMRSEEKIYEQLGWEPVAKQENNAWGRLLVRLEEIEQSVMLINKADKRGKTDNIDLPGSREGTAKLESPRGTVTLNIHVDSGKVVQLEIQAPSRPLAGLIPTLTEEAELSDALVQIASLDIAPWEVGLKSPEVK